MDNPQKKLFHIFTAGKYLKFVAGKWKEVEITAEMVQQVADNYDPSFYEAPLWIGHPDTGAAPAYAWVGGLKAENGKLYCWFSYVSDEFMNMTKTKKYKRVSVELIMKSSLKHDIPEEEDGLYMPALGATNMPHVTGLPAMDFENYNRENAVVGSIPLKFEFEFFTNQNNNDDMKISEAVVKFANSIGLKINDYTTDSAVLEKASELIGALKAKFSDNPDEIGSLDMFIGKFESHMTEHNQIKAQLNTEREDKIKFVLDSAVKTGAIKPEAREKFENILKADFESGCAVLSEMKPAPFTFSNVVPPGNNVTPTTQDSSDDKFLDENGKKLSFSSFLEKVAQDPSFADKYSNEDLAKLEGYDPSIYRAARG